MQAQLGTAGAASVPTMVQESSAAPVDRPAPGAETSAVQPSAPALTRQVHGQAATAATCVERPASAPALTRRATAPETNAVAFATQQAEEDLAALQASELSVCWPQRASRGVRKAAAATAADASLASAPAVSVEAAASATVPTAAASLEMLAQAEDDLAALQASGLPVRWQQRRCRTRSSRPARTAAGVIDRPVCLGEAASHNVMQ